MCPMSYIIKEFAVLFQMPQSFPNSMNGVKHYSQNSEALSRKNSSPHVWWDMVVLTDYYRFPERNFDNFKSGIIGSLYYFHSILHHFEFYTKSYKVILKPNFTQPQFILFNFKKLINPLLSNIFISKGRRRIQVRVSICQID